MWKILLVEDEPFVRRSIRSAIPWENSGFAIVGEASHGLEAMELIRKHRPDVVISDIIMPYMDGIELLQEARKEGCEACFIMLTCANEFEYARLALEHGATSYILKLSMEDDQLVQALAKAKSQLDRQAEQKDMLLRDSFQERFPLVWKALYGKELTPHEEDKLAEFRQMERQYPRLTVISALNGSQPFAYADVRKHPALAGMEPQIVQSFSRAGQTTLFLWGGRAPALPAGSHRIMAGERPIVCRTSSGSRSFEEEWLHNLHWLDGLYYGEPAEPGARGDREAGRETQAVPWEMEQEMIRLFEGVELQECVRRLTDMWAYMRQVSMPMALAKETAVRLDKLFARICRKQAASADDILLCTSHGGVLDAVVHRMEQYAKGRSKQTYPETDHPEVNKIIRYLLQHYDKDISLQAMAHYVSMDENYLSGLFKKKTGDTFINYLQQIRVNEAKFYLEQTELTVADIGERSGFVNPSYFFKIFKRWTGLTPNEYRAEHKNRERPR